MKKTRVTKGYVTVPALAPVLGMSHLTLLRAVRQGLLPLAKREGKGSRWRIAQAELRKALLPELPEAPAPAPIPPGYLTVEQAAKALGVSTAQIYYLIKGRHVRSERFDDRLCVHEREVAGYDAARKVAKEARTLKLRIAQLTKQHAELTRVRGELRAEQHEVH